jgi:hypothetical protein
MLRTITISSTSAFEQGVLIMAMGQQCSRQQLAVS